MPNDDTQIRTLPIAQQPLTTNHPPKHGKFNSSNARALALRSVAARAAKRQLANPSGQPANAKPAVQAGERTSTVLVVAPLPRPESSVGKAGDEAREYLAKSIVAQAKVLASKPPRSRSALTGREGTAQGTKTLADAAATVFGWGDTQPGGLIVVGQVTQMGELPQAQTAKVGDCQPATPTAGQPGGPALDVPDTPKSEPQPISSTDSTGHPKG